MSMKILLPIATYPEATSKAGIGQALGLSARLEASVTTLIQEVDIAPVHSALGEALLGISELAAEAEARSQERGAEMRLWVEEHARRLGIASLEASMERCRPESFADCLLPIARCHDLTATVFDANDPQRRAEIETLIFGSGGPVVVVPASDAVATGAGAPATPLKIVVAWDGSPSASRALRDAIPILAYAGTVSIVTIDDDKTIEPRGIAGVQAWLEEHGVHGQHLPRTRGSSPIGDTLQAVAAGQDADLLVMGAFGRNRLQEFILGGATRTVLHAPRLPVLLSHY